MSCKALVCCRNAAYFKEVGRTEDNLSQSVGRGPAQAAAALREDVCLSSAALVHSQPPNRVTRRRPWFSRSRRAVPLAVIRGPLI